MEHERSRQFDEGGTSHCSHQVCGRKGTFRSAVLPLSCVKHTLTSDCLQYTAEEQLLIAMDEARNQWQYDQVHPVRLEFLTFPDLRLA